MKRFSSNHECLTISNDGLTVHSDGLYGTILLGEFIETGFFAAEFKIDKNNYRAGIAILGDRFNTWKGAEIDEDWIVICIDNAYGSDEWMEQMLSGFSVVNTSGCDIASVMIDKDKNTGEFSNKNKKQHQQIKLPDRPCGIGVYCYRAQFTVIKQIFNRNQYDSNTK